VTKKEIVKQIAEKYDEPQVKVKDIVQETFDLIIAALVKEGRIELRNFGVFEVKRRKPRRARNPRTNQPVEVQAKNVVTFQPGKIMEEKVRDAEQVVLPRSGTPKPAKAAKHAPSQPPSHTSVADDPEDEPVPVGVPANGSIDNETDTELEPPTARPHKPR
jgi:nucleoid DNA-binding protein